MHRWITWIIRQPSVDQWFRVTEAKQNTRFTLDDREGMGKLLASTYVKNFLLMQGVNSPDSPFRISGPGELEMLVEWTCDEHPEWAELLKARMQSFFEVAPAASNARFALEVEAGIWKKIDHAISMLTKVS
jgi:hypothetical protein